ncbi:MAG: SRPBCC family protein [Hyphomonadaceae bacterium]|nr:SRPBCC family protein [Hyphomonadaceae bacterium]
MSNNGDERIVPPDLVYVFYIRSTAPKVWEALTSSEFTTKFFFGRTVESDWKQGSAWKMVMPDGALDVWGEVLISDPPKKLQVTWTVDWVDEADKTGPAIITYDIEQAGEAVKLTMTQHSDYAIARKYIQAGAQGWAIILSSLKSLLETGEPLVVKMAPPK